MEGSQPPSLVSLLGLGVPAGGRRCEQEELYAMWMAARAEANCAYEDWRDNPGSQSFWTYRAAEERADAAQDALAEAWRRNPRDGSWRAAA